MEMKTLNSIEELNKGLKEFFTGVSENLNIIMTKVETPEKKKVTMDDVKTILPKATNDKLNSVILKMAELVDNDDLDSTACDSGLDMFMDSLEKVKKHKEKELPAIEVITDMTSKKKEISKEAQETIDKLSSVLNAEFSDISKEVKEGLDDLLKEADLTKDDYDIVIDTILDDLKCALKGESKEEEIPFDEDAPKDSKKKDKPKVIDGEFREVEPEGKKKQEKKVKEPFKLFTSEEEAEKAAKEQTERERQKLEKVNNLPPISTKQIIISNAEKPIENEKVRDYLYPLFEKALRGEPFEIMQCENGFFNLHFAGITFPIDNNSIIRQGAHMIMDITFLDPVLGTKKLPEFVSVKMRPDLVYAWTHDPNLRSAGISDPDTIQNLQTSRKIPYDIIRQIDLSFKGLPKDLPENDKLIQNLMALLHHSEMKEIPGIKYRFTQYKNENKFTLVSDSLVKAPMALFNSSINRISDPELTVAFNNPNNIKIMYNGYKKVFSLNGNPVEKESTEEK